jgi:FlaA1/EpsC-like NDP-sugar epimerase
MKSFLLKRRRAVAELLQAALVSLALAASFLLRFEFQLLPPYPDLLLAALPLVVIVKLAVFRYFGLRDLAWRFLGFRDLLRMAGANLAASGAAAVVVRLALGSAFPRSIYVIDLLATVALIAGTHAAGKLLLERRAGGEKAARRIAVYGAGRNGVTLLSEIRANPDMGFEVCGFFDDDPAKRDLRLHGVRVLGGLKDLGATLRRERVEMVLLAMPSASGNQLTAILEACHAAKVAAQRVPALADWIGCPPNGHQALAQEIREVRIEDLLGRQPVELDREQIGERLKGRVVLVTGAGGSIGSELCRQIARFEPGAIVGFDQGESALYEIDREMRARFPRVAFFPEVGSVQAPRRLADVFREHGPQSVYHAAAYKHVPLMESHLFQAVENNVFGTSNLVRAAAEYGVEDFVLISSDKAVRPANVMGATKRLAELVAQSALQTHDSRMRSISVRFGNVLGSSGSVIPLFREQIAGGGPVTVTHPEMRRFFMTIPEAAQLVLQSAAMGRDGEILVLEMGEPVRILDLARKMILLSGLRPGEDIPIEFCGIRPGEKLYEELSAYEEDTVATRHPQIRVFAGPRSSPEMLNRGLAQLRAAVEHGDAGAAVLCLKELVPDYNPSAYLLRRAFEERARGVYA